MQGERVGGQEIPPQNTQQIWNSLPKDARRLSVFLSPQITATSERMEMIEEFSIARTREGETIGRLFDSRTAMVSLTRAGVLQRTTALEDWLHIIDNYSYQRDLQGVPFEEQTQEERAYLLARRLRDQYNANPQGNIAAATEPRYKLTPEFKQFVGERYEQLQEFEKTYNEGLTDFVDNFLGGGLVDSPIPLDPFSLGISEQVYDDLLIDEREIIEDSVLVTLGLTSSTLEEQQKEREYDTKAPSEARVPGNVHINVYRTNREDIFLQEMSFADGQTWWAVEPNQDM